MKRIDGIYKPDFMVDPPRVFWCDSRLSKTAFHLLFGRLVSVSTTFEHPVSYTREQAQWLT